MPKSSWHQQERLSNPFVNGLPSWQTLPSILSIVDDPSKGRTMKNNVST